MLQYVVSINKSGGGDQGQPGCVELVVAATALSGRPGQQRR